LGEIDKSLFVKDEMQARNIETDAVIKNDVYKTNCQDVRLALT